MTYENPKAVYACLNQGEAFAPREIAERSVCINVVIGETLEKLKCKAADSLAIYMMLESNCCGASGTLAAGTCGLLQPSGEIVGSACPQPHHAKIFREKQC